jgi:hypothetical protein
MKSYKIRSIIFLSAFLLYLLSANLVVKQQSITPQYVYLANAFLHGRLDLAELPQNTYDLILYEGHWFVPGALAPALLMMPFVAIVGIGFSDVFFGILIGALNVLLMYILLGRLGMDEISPKRLWLTILFAIGTVHWWVTSLGNTWFNAHSVAVMFILLFVNETLTDQRPWLAGLWLGLAGLSRPPTLFAAFFFLVYAFSLSHDWRMVFQQKLLPFGLTLSLGVGVILIYNVLRFGNPLEFGYRYVQGSYAIVQAIERYGSFSHIYMPCNLYISLVGPPNLPGAAALGDTICWQLGSLSHSFEAPFEFFDPRGMSIFLTTPAFLYLFKARWHEPLVRAALAGSLAVLLVLWMYSTTGWVQFGYRYILDIIPFLIILVSSGMPSLTKHARLLIVLSSIINSIGYLMMFKAVYGAFPLGI